jgi:kynureninase
MAAFYKPDIKGRHKIIIENKAFPSDHVRHSSTSAVCMATNTCHK